MLSFSLAILRPCRSRRTFLLFAGGLFALLGPSRAQTPIDNAALLPKWLPDDQVRMEGTTPDWVKTLIMAEVRLETATPEGTFAAATRVLDHYAEMGVNGLWIDPIYDRRGPQKNGYNNMGPTSIYPALSGTADPDASLQAAKGFVDQAHRRNIRIFFDIIVWGTRMDSPLVASHPEFYARKNGDYIKVWGGYAFDWQSAPLKRWFSDAASRLIEKTGADGFRVDLAPDTSGYYFKEVRDALHAAGHKIIVISEIASSRRDVFDFEQVGVSGWTERSDYAHPEKLKEQKERFGPHSEAFFRNNIVDAIRTGYGIGEAALQQQGHGGDFRFYTFNLLDHDDHLPFAAGSRVRFAYSSIFAPFLPLWWIGEEWNNPALEARTAGVMYFNSINWNQLAVNRAFYEDTKRYIRIRRSYPEIFQCFPPSARDANITRLDTTRAGVPNPLQAYARFAGGRAILVVPNNESQGGAAIRVNPDYPACGLDPSLRYTITDLMTGQAIATTAGQASPDPGFTVNIAPGNLGIYLLDRAKN